jgi:hypothetical protein
VWRERILRAFADAKFTQPATSDQIAEAERQLEVRLPDELKGLLRESNGVSANYSSPFLWSVDEIVEQNRMFRANTDFAELYMPFDCLLFFGADGGGDQFAYRILAGTIPDTSWIYRWCHENDSRHWFASNLHDYFVRLATTER